jgi:hypothetical protein
MIYQTTRQQGVVLAHFRCCRTKGVLVVELEKKKLVSARAVASFIIGGAREASALPPAHHMARILAPLLPERASVRRRITAHQPLQISLSIIYLPSLLYL